MVFEYTMVSRGSRVRRTLEEITEKPKEQPVATTAARDLMQCVYRTIEHYGHDFHKEVFKYRICTDEEPALASCGVVVAFYK